MNYYNCKKDLCTFFPLDLHYLSRYYNVDNTNQNDLLWLLAITILDNVPTSIVSFMPPEKIWSIYKDNVLKKFTTDDSSPKDITELPREFLTTDPTNNKKYLEWIVKSLPCCKG